MVSRERAYHQRASLAGTNGQLLQLRSEDAALNQERQNLSDAAEVGRIAREQYQLVSPGQKAYEVLPPSGIAPANRPTPAIRATTPGGSDGGIGAASRDRHHDNTTHRRPTVPTGDSAARGPHRRKGPRPHAERARILALNTQDMTGVPPSTTDRDAVAQLLGRDPIGHFCVARRRADGQPVVIANDPLLLDGTPMPTRYWLVDPVIRSRIGLLESEGGVKEAELAVDAGALAAAHVRYAAERDALVPVGWQGPRPSGGVGGTRRGVKCLHAHVAWWLVGGDDPIGDWAAVRIGLTRP